MDNTDGCYHLDPTFLGKISIKDIQRFASLAGVKGLFPSLANDFLRDIFDSRLQPALLVKGHHYENIGDKGALFRDLEKAIIAHHPVSFSYIKPEGLKSYQSVLPYKLVNHKGIWYFVGQDGEKLKSFSITKLSNLITLETFFVWDSKIDTQLVEDDGIWLSNAKQEVVLKVRAEVAGYFKRRKLIANQVIEKELEDGGLIISAKIGHTNQILPIVRYWIPNIRIISPEHLQVEIDKSLNEYLGRTE
jgi:predicted DNA-binding transcriptional regulator YafY